jgi:hypothetical protein
MNSVLIPEDHWIGSRCLDLGLPWLTPGAIRWLAANLKPTDCVLELGSGGSTVFFATRCKVVQWHGLGTMIARRVKNPNAPPGLRGIGEHFGH